MTRKDLIKIVKRFPKTAQVKLNGNEPTIRAQVDEQGNWSIIIENKKVNEIGENNSCQNENN